MIAAILLLLQETGTAPGRALPPSDGETEQVAAWLREFDYPADPFDWRLEPEFETSHLAVGTVSFPSPTTTDVEANNTVVGHYYRPAGDGPFPALVVLHWLGGDYTALRFFCTALAGRGIAALMIYMPYYGPREGDSGREMVDGENLEATVANFRQAIGDARRASHWLRARPEVGDDRVGVLGVSLGAIVGAAVAGVEPDISPAVFVIGGGDLGAVLTNDAPETAEARRRLAELGLTPDQVRDAMRPIDPVTYAHRIRDDGVLMINARDDEIIPRACTESLARAIGEPRIEWFDGGHYDVVGQMPRVLDLTVEHVNR